MRLMGFGSFAPKQPIAWLDLAESVVEAAGVTRFRVGTAARRRRSRRDQGLAVAAVPLVPYDFPLMPRFFPSPELRDRVKWFDVVEGPETGATVLPSAAAVMGVQFRGRVQAERGLLALAGVTGLQNQPRRYEYVNRAASVLVRFTPQGATCLGVPASALFNESIALEDLVPAGHVRALTERVAAASHDRARVAVVEEFLRSLPFLRDPVVTQALERLKGDIEDASIAAIARALSLSERQLERRFRQRVGLSPKQFASLSRFERAVELSGRSMSLARAAVEAGYYDQSHFVRDFRRYARVAPNQILRRR